MFAATVSSHMLGGLQHLSVCYVRGHNNAAPAFDEYVPAREESCNRTSGGGGRSCSDWLLDLESASKAARASAAAAARTGSAELLCSTQTHINAVCAQTTQGKWKVMYNLIRNIIVVMYM